MPCEGCATKNNKPPIAVAGPDQVITLPTDSVLLDGSASSDPDGKISEWLWTKISGPASFTVAKPSDSITTIKTIVAGVYQIELRVIDNAGLFAKDTMQVIVNTTSTDLCASYRPIINAQLVPLGTLSESRTGVSVGAAGNKIVFAGGQNGDAGVSTVDIYDIVTQSWSIAELSIARNDMGVTVSGDNIFFAGGVFHDGTAFNIHYNRIDIYNASTNTWTIDSLTWPRVSPAGEVINNKVFFGGGWDWHYDNTDHAKVVDIKDLSTNTWSATALSETKAHLSSETMGNKIYFAGGAHGYYYPILSNRVDVYDNTTASWSLQTMLEPKAHFASIGAAGKIFWAGGMTDSFPAGQRMSALVEIKDIATNTSTQACLFQPNAFFSAVLKNNKIVFFTGEGAVKNKFDIYDVTTNTWSIGVLPVELQGASIISVNNTIYVAGGFVNGVLSTQVYKLEF